MDPPSFEKTLVVPPWLRSLVCLMNSKTIEVDYNGMLVVYSEDMTYSMFCEKNPRLETRVEWDETTSDAMDCYYYCKEKTIQ